LKALEYEDLQMQELVHNERLRIIRCQQTIKSAEFATLKFLVEMLRRHTELRISETGKSLFLLFPSLFSVFHHLRSFYFSQSSVSALSSLSLSLLLRGYAF
jgi:hypothetical protein